MDPIQTANKFYRYDKKIGDETLEMLVQKLHEYNCKENGWTFNKLKVGCYGFDNLAVCIGYVFDNADKIMSVDEIAEMIHNGWVINYIYWRDNMPWVDDNVKYIKPFKPINDDRRNSCASIDYKDLPDDEKEKDLILARWFKVFFLNKAI